MSGSITDTIKQHKHACHAKDSRNHPSPDNPNRMKHRRPFSPEYKQGQDCAQKEQPYRRSRVEDRINKRTRDQYNQ